MRWLGWYLHRWRVFLATAWDHRKAQAKYGGLAVADACEIVGMTLVAVLLIVMGITVGVTTWALVGQ